MQCIGERSTALTGAAIDDRLTKVASELKKRDAVLVRQKDSEVSFVSCSIHLGPNSFVFLGHGRLSVKSSGDGNSICFSVEVPVVDNAFFGLLFSTVPAVLVLSTGVGWFLSICAFSITIAIYMRWAKNVAYEWMESVLESSDAKQAL